jgi:hypothetical protein
LAGQIKRFQPFGQQLILPKALNFLGLPKNIFSHAELFDE